MRDAPIVEHRCASISCVDPESNLARLGSECALSRTWSDTDFHWSGATMRDSMMRYETTGIRKAASKATQAFLSCVCMVGS